MNLVTWLDRAARARPGDVAIYRGAAPWASYGELAGRVARLAAGLGRRLAPGSRVALFMKNCPESCEARYAAWWAGLAVVPVNAKLHPRELAFIIENSGAELLIEDPGQLAGLAIDETPPPAAARPDDLAWLFYTSGTTGRPKGAMLSHQNLAQMTNGYFADVDAVGRDGRLLHAAPLSHGSGLYNFTHLARGAAQVLPESGTFEPAEILALLETHRNVSFFAAPTIVNRLVAAARAAP